MIFESQGFYVDLVKDEDLNDIIEVYNSNKHFLLNHVDMDNVTYEWLVEELRLMKKAGFYSCKIVEKHSDKIIGIVDFKIDEQTYLSLLMLHNNYKNKGFGKSIYMALEQHIKSAKSKCIRIDVVTNYDDMVLDFWSKNGFDKFENIELNWAGKILSAVIMKN